MRWYPDRPQLPGLLSGKVGLAEILASVDFAVYGLINNPRGITVQSVGYTSHLDYRTNQSAPIIVEVSLRFAPRAEQTVNKIEQWAVNRGPRMHLTTRNPAQLALFGSLSTGAPFPDGEIYDTDGRPIVRYTSVEDVTTSAAPIRSCVIARFPLSKDQEPVVAVLRHWMRPNPEWLFSLTRPGLHVVGQAWELPQTEFLELLSHIGIITNHSEVVAQYQREMADWSRYFQQG